MPIFEYQCPKCDKIEEHMHKYDDYFVAFCVECNVEAKKIVSATGFRLLGEWTSATKPPIDWD